MVYDPRLSHFDIDLKRGAQGELMVLNIMEMLKEGSGQVEVKDDYKFAETHRFYVECECRGRDGKWRPSGINTTKAKLWAFVFGELPGCLVVETDWVKRAVDRAATDKRNVKSCDYGQNPTRGVLVYFNHFILTSAA